MHPVNRCLRARPANRCGQSVRPVSQGPQREPGCDAIRPRARFRLGVNSSAWETRCPYFSSQVLKSTPAVLFGRPAVVLLVLRVVGAIISLALNPLKLQVAIIECRRAREQEKGGKSGFACSLKSDDAFCTQFFLSDYG